MAATVETRKDISHWLQSMRERFCTASVCKNARDPNSAYNDTFCVSCVTV
jgi:hypothetical protein